MGRMEHTNELASRQQYKHWYAQNVGYYPPPGAAAGRVLLAKGLLALVDPGQRASPLAGRPGYEQPAARSDLSVHARIRELSSD